MYDMPFGLLVATSHPTRHFGMQYQYKGRRGGGGGPKQSTARLHKNKLLRTCKNTLQDEESLDWAKRMVLMVIARVDTDADHE